MALVIADRVRETTSSAGTGTLTLTGAFAGFQPFSVIGNGNTTYYCIIDATNGAWEVGIGTYTSSGNTLSRDTVLSSSNADALVPFAVGLKDVICTQPAERAVYAVGTDVVAANNAKVPNSLLANSGITFGSTAQALGSTVTALNGVTIGATTAAAGSFTTLTTSSTVTLNGGTANGVAYLNGSKVLTTGSALQFDGSNLGLGVTPSAWSGYKPLQAGSGASFGGYAGDVLSFMGSNTYNDNTNWRYILSGNAAARYQQSAGTHAWFTAPSGTAGNAISFTQAMTLDASGNLLVGTTSGAYSATDKVAVSPTTSNGTGIGIGCPNNSSVRGLGIYHGFASGTNSAVMIQFQNSSSGVVGSIQSTGSATSYNTSSDYRLKENIQPMTGALAKVAALKPCTYNWKADGSEGEGFIAHELAEICPQAVTGEKDAVDAEGKPVYQGIDTSFLVATLTAAIKEQQTIINQLKARLDAANL